MVSIKETNQEDVLESNPDAEKEEILDGDYDDKDLVDFADE